VRPGSRPTGKPFPRAALLSSSRDGGSQASPVDAARETAREKEPFLPGQGCASGWYDECMKALSWFLVFIACGAVAAAAAAFNRMVKLRNRVRKAWKDVDVQLDLRYRLLPLLAGAARGYAQREAAALEKAARARGEIQGVGPAERAARERAVAEAAQEAMLISERYPILKSDASFARLVEELVRVEDHLAGARKYYNGCVRAYNTFTQAFPFNLLARLLGFRPAEYFHHPPQGKGDEDPPP